MTDELEALVGFIETWGMERSRFILIGVKPEGWLVHGTDFRTALAIGEEGFKYGEPNFAGLAYTLGDRRGHGYNFALELEFVGNKTNLSYGNAVVLLRAPYVLAYHIDDNEPQAIFWGPDATDIWVVNKNPPYGRKTDAFYITVWDDDGNSKDIYGDTLNDIVQIIEASGD